MARNPVVPEATAVRTLTADFVDKPDLGERRQPFATVVREVKIGRCASGGEGVCGKRDELRQFPQILGGGSQ